VRTEWPTSRRGAGKYNINKKGSEMSKTRTQHYIDPITGERKEIKVKSIADKFKQGGKNKKTGALMIPKELRGSDPNAQKPKTITDTK
jgi:hypothetical protein